MYYTINNELVNFGRLGVHCEKNISREERTHKEAGGSDALSTDGSDFRKCYAELNFII